MQTLIGGDTIAFINMKTGNVWAGASSDVKSVNPTTASPKMKLGTGGRIAVTTTVRSAATGSPTARF